MRVSANCCRGDTWWNAAYWQSLGERVRIMLRVGDGEAALERAAVCGLPGGCLPLHVHCRVRVWPADREMGVGEGCPDMLLQATPGPLQFPRPWHHDPRLARRGRVAQSPPVVATLERGRGGGGGGRRLLGRRRRRARPRPPRGVVVLSCDHRARLPRRDAWVRRLVVAIKTAFD